MARLTFYLGNKLPDGTQLPLIFAPVQLFNLDYTKEWLNTDLAKYIIKTIDKSDHIKDHVIESPVLGAIPPKELSCGCKSVLLAAFHPDALTNFFSGAKMGDNCFPVLFDVAERTGRDIKIRVGRLLERPWDDRHEVLFLPTNDVVAGYANINRYLGLHTDLFYRGME